jgi:hypothetical protein
MLVGALAPLGLFHLLPAAFSNILGFVGIMTISIGLIVYGVLLYASTLQILFKRLGWIKNG